MQSTLWLSALAVLVLLFASALFSSAETSFTAASRARIHRLAREGNRRALIIEALFDLRERVIGSILLANNLVNIMASALATGLLIGLVGASGVLYATILMTVLIVLFGEVLPKTFALSRPERLALMLAPLLRGLIWLLWPALKAIECVTHPILRLIIAKPTADAAAFSSQEEIRGAIDLHAQEGGMVEEHKQMLGSILDLDDVVIGDVMVHRQKIEMIDADEPVEKIIRHVVKSSHTRIPLYRNNPENIIGILHAKDVLRALSRRGAKPIGAINIERIMSRPVFAPDTTTLREQLNAFITLRNHFALVVDEYGGLQGLVTLEDILEEIVGDITDEHDLPIPEGVKQLDDGSLSIEGSVTLRELNRRFGWTLPDDEATTIAGLVINEAQVLPVAGQHFDLFGFRFDILERNRNRITLLRVVPPVPVVLEGHVRPAGSAPTGK